MYLLINDISYVEDIFQRLDFSGPLKVCIPIDQVGVNFGAALRNCLGERFGEQIESIAADAAEFSGVALHALHMGFKEVLFAGPQMTLESLQQEAKAFGAVIIPYDINDRNSLIKY